MNLEKVKPLLETKLTEMGYELYSLNFKVNKGEKTLDIVVDKVLPIDMNEIVKVSEALSTYLDEIDDSNDPYILEVSSLGAEKPLKVEALANYIDRYVEVRMINPILGENIYEGYIRSVASDSINLEYRIKSRTKEINIAKNNISKIRLAIKF